MSIQQDFGQGNLLSPREFAERLSISRWTVYSWISNGRISSVKVGRLVRIPQSEVDRIIRGKAEPKEVGCK